MSFFESETISRIIIDKLISNVILDNNIKCINSKLNKHIEKFMFQMISPLMKANYFYHETDQDKTDENIILFDKEQINKINTWEIIPEPETCVVDRFARKNKLITNKLKKSDKNINIWDNAFKELEGEQDIKNSNNSNKGNDKILFGLNKTKKKYSNRILFNKFLIKKKKIETNEDNKEKEKKKELILEIPGVDIPYNNKEKIHILLNDTEENDRLRNEWKFQEIEKKKKLLKEQLNQKKLKQKLLFNKEIKIFNPNGVTFDSNGNILKLNLQNVNSFQNGFISSKTSLKKKNEEKTPLLTSPQITHNSKNNNKEIIEYNQEEKIRYNMDFGLNNLNFNLDKENNNKKKKPENIILSGSNFDKINPEIGVIISNNDNEKEKKVGGFDYIKKYNKPSMNELSQFLSNSNSNSNLNSYSKIASFLNSNSNINNYNYLGYKEHFNEEKNPLFQNAVYINEDKKNKKSRNSFLMSTKKSLSNENIFQRNSLMKNNNNNIILFKGQNFNINDNATNNILLSQKFNLPNLKLVFSEANENHINTDINKMKNKKLGKIKVMKENKSNIIYSMKDLKKNKNNNLPEIKFDNNQKRKIFGQDYINKFLINTIQKRNMSYDNFDNINNDINKENSYKNIFLRAKKNKLK